MSDHEGVVTGLIFRKGAKRGRSARRDVTAVVKYGLVSLIALFTIYPLFLMVMLAFGSSGSVQMPNPIPSRFTTDNFAAALQTTSVARWTLNSLMKAGISVIITLIVSSMAAYAFAKLRFRGRSSLFWVILSMLMVPGQLTVVPLYLMVANAGGMNTYWGLIVPELANVQAVFLMRQFILDLPDDLVDAARMDGASEFGIYRRVIVPLILPIMATLGIFLFLWQWNDLLWPLLVTSASNMYTLTVGLSTMETLAPPLGQLMATSTISFIPSIVVFLVLQRYIRGGIAMTGMR